MKPKKNPDPYAINQDATEASPKAPPKAEPEGAGDEAGSDAGSDAGSAAPAGGQAALFSSCLVNEVHVISFSRPDVLDAVYIERLGDDVYHHLRPFDEPRVVIDLDNVQHLSSAALGMLIALKKVVEKKGGRICLANVRDQLMQIFKLTKLHKHLKIHDGVDKAVRSLG